MIRLSLGARALLEHVLSPRLAMALGGARAFSPSDSAGESDPILDAFFEQSVDPLLTLDASYTILEANPAAARMLKAPVEKLEGSSVLEIDLLARLVTAGSILQRLKTDSPPVSDEVSVTDAEGQPIQCRLEAIVLDDGVTLLHLHDTTAVLRVRDALRASERLHEAVLEAMPEVAWSMALPEERLLEVSGSVERLFGYQPAAFREHPSLWEEIVHPAERERVRAEFRKGIASARPFHIEFTGMHRDHRDLPFLMNHVVPVADDRGWVDRCQGFIEDLSERVALEGTLADVESHLKHVLESVSSGVAVVEPGEKSVTLALCNRRLADMLGLDEPPRPGSPLALATPELRDIVYGPHSEIEFERRILSEEIRDEVTEIEEPHRVLRRYTGPVRDSLGAVTGRIITVEDVTGPWLLQRRLTHAQKMESMGRLAGGVAHDFNNLLGTMLGFGSLLLEQTPEGDPRREALAAIVSSAERAGRLTAALLAFSRTARFERLPVQLNRIIEESYQLLRSALDPSVAMELKLDPQLPPMMGDALLLQQIVVNLVQEVRDRFAGGGSLFLKTRMLEPPETPPERSAEGGSHRMIALEVEVSGATPRDRAADERDREARPGLALTIAEDIARAHSGYLVSGLGASPALFRLVFPVETPGETPLIVPEVATARGHETLLVVDDEPGLRVLASTGLKRLGFDVIVAENGERALEILHGTGHSVDLVVLDLSMPGLSGERVLRAIRGFRPDLPVVIASGYATVESQTAWNAAGAQGFVAKPYRVQDIAVKVREVLDRAHGRVL
jgi:PAS domain S-box-containing protein